MRPSCFLFFLFGFLLCLFSVLSVTLWLVPLFISSFGLHDWDRSPTIRPPRLHGRGASEPSQEASGSHAFGTDPPARRLSHPPIVTGPRLVGVPLSAVRADCFPRTRRLFRLRRRHPPAIQDP